MDRGDWQATVHGVTRVRHDLATKPPPKTVKQSECREGNCELRGKTASLASNWGLQVRVHKTRLWRTWVKQETGRSVGGGKDIGFIIRINMLPRMY